MRTWVITGAIFAIAGCSTHGSAGPGAVEGTGGASLGGAGGAGAGAGGVESQGGASPQGGQAGLCSPKDGPSWDALMPTAVKLYESDNILDEQWLDGGNYYFYERDKGIQRMPEQGGTPELLVTVPAGANTAGQFFLTTGHLYWTSFEATTATGPTDMRRVPREQWTATPEVLGAPLRAGLKTADEDALYGYDQTAGELWSQNFKTGAVTVLVANVEVAAMSLVSGYVYFADSTFGGENISRITVAGGTRERMADGRGPSLGGLGVFGQHIFWDSGGSIYDTTVGDLASTKEIGHPGPGGFAYASIELFALRGERLYFRDDGANVAWTSLDGASCGTVLSGVIIDAIFGTNDLFVSIFDFPNSLWRTPL